MKHFLTIILTFVPYLAVWSQANINHQLLQTNSKSHLYYIDMKDNEAKVYMMGRGYIDVAGSGYSIRYTDTLQKQSDSSYASGRSRIVREKDKLYLFTTVPTSRKLLLDSVSNTALANNNLNNAYYLGRYFAMSRKLNEAFPLNHHDFRRAYFTWEALSTKDKEMDYLPFRDFADARLKKEEDSTNNVHHKYIHLTNYIVQNIHGIDYPSLKDSIAQLPAEPAGKSQYYGTVINAVVVSQPEYFLRLAEDFPEHRSLIFQAAADNKQARTSIENVQSHDDMKKTFLKERKSTKALPFQAIGAVALGVGLVVLIIIAF